MICKIPAETESFCLPVEKKGESFPLIIRNSDGFLRLQVIPASPEDAVYTATYRLPFDWKDTFLEADSRVFEFLTWLKAPENTAAASPDLEDRHEADRPQFHFSPRQGWINDPNGMYWQDGVWHLFFQYNPFGPYWENMHWGHAVSKDLLHWEEKELALYPDSTGTMYSGSAVIDHCNSAGFGKDAVLLYYTSCSYSRPSTGTQNLAVAGNGQWKKYAGNPVIPCLSGKEERDPNIAFDPDHGLWRMVVFSGDETQRDFILFASRDLLHWEKTDRYRIPGDRECPGLRRMKDEISGEYLWVFTAANGYYRTGRISADGKIAFLTAGSDRFLYGDAYAGQFFCNSPDERHIFMAWVRMPDALFDTWTGCMTLPLELVLSNGKLLVSPAVDVPATKVCWSGKTEIQGRSRSLLIDPEKDCIQDRSTVYQIQAGHQWSGCLVKDRALIEYFDGKKRFFAAFYFPGADQVSFL